MAVERVRAFTEGQEGEEVEEGGSRVERGIRGVYCRIDDEWARVLVHARGCTRVLADFYFNSGELRFLFGLGINKSLWKSVKIRECCQEYLLFVMILWECEEVFEDSTTFANESSCKGSFNSD